MARIPTAFEMIRKHAPGGRMLRPMTFQRDPATGSIIPGSYQPVSDADVKHVLSHGTMYAPRPTLNQTGQPAPLGQTSTPGGTATPGSEIAKQPAGLPPAPEAGTGDYGASGKYVDNRGNNVAVRETPGAPLPGFPGPGGTVAPPPAPTPAPPPAAPQPPAAPPTTTPPPAPPANGGTSAPPPAAPPPAAGPTPPPLPPGPTGGPSWLTFQFPNPTEDWQKQFNAFQQQQPGMGYNFVTARQQNLPAGMSPDDPRAGAYMAAGTAGLEQMAHALQAAGFDQGTTDAIRNLYGSSGSTAENAARQLGVDQSQVGANAGGYVIKGGQLFRTSTGPNNQAQYTPVGAVAGALPGTGTQYRAGTTPGAFTGNSTAAPVTAPTPTALGAADAAAATAPRTTTPSMKAPVSDATKAGAGIVGSALPPPAPTVTPPPPAAPAPAPVPVPTPPPAPVPTPTAPPAPRIATTQPVGGATPVTAPAPKSATAPVTATPKPQSDALPNAAGQTGPVPVKGVVNSALGKF